MPKKSPAPKKESKTPTEEAPKSDVQDEPKRPHDRSLSELLDMSLSMPVTPIKKRSSKKSHPGPSMAKKPLKKHVAYKAARKARSPKNETKDKKKKKSTSETKPKKKRQSGSKQKAAAKAK
jgi:hypothetical protein